MKLREISEEELTEVLREHEKWLDSNRKEGKRADLSYTDLSGAYLFEANLSRADLSRANLSGADLSRANLSRANLFGVDLSGANLFGADLSGADLSKADLSGAYLFVVDLSEASLFEIDLSEANLLRANLFGVDLSKANLSGANLHYANLCNTKLENVKYDDATQYFALQCPKKGEFVTYKKAYEPISGLSCIVKLLIPADALRSSATTKKCRCNKAKVLSITDLDNTEVYQEAFSRYDTTFIYKVGETVEVSDFDKDRWEECAPGIHFFMRRMDAVNY